MSEALTPRQQRRAARKAARLLAAAEALKPKERDPAEVKREERIAAKIAAAVKPSGFTPATDPDKGGYAVFANANRRSALRCPLDGGGMVEYIAMTDQALKVETCTEMFFNTMWVRADYEPKRAAAAYATAAKWRGITEEAKVHLERVLGTPLKNVKTQQSEVNSRSKDMRKRTSHSSDTLHSTLSVTDDSAAPAAAEQPGASAPATASKPKKNKGMKKQPAAKKGKAKPAKKGKAKPAKKTSAKKDAAPTGKRAEMHAMKIKVLQPKNPKREGTDAYKKYEVYKTAKTVGEALEKGEKVGFRMSTINYDVKHKYIQLVKP